MLDRVIRGRGAASWPFRKKLQIYCKNFQFSQNPIVRFGFPENQLKIKTCSIRWRPQNEDAIGL